MTSLYSNMTSVFYETQPDGQSNIHIRMASEGNAAWPVLILMCGFIVTSALTFYSLAIKKRLELQASRRTSDRRPGPPTKVQELVVLMNPPDYISHDPPPYSVIEIEGLSKDENPPEYNSYNSTPTEISPMNEEAVQHSLETS